MPSNKIETILLHDEKNAISDLLENGDLKIGYFLSRSKVKTTGDNEDALFISSDAKRIRMGVSDGAGGHPRGRDAAVEVTSELSKLDELPVLDKVAKANQRVLDLKAGSRSTLAMVEVWGDEVTFYTVGDSEVIYWNAGARELYSSTPHSPTGHKVEAGVSSQEESLQDPERHIVNRMMGDEFIQLQSTTKLTLKKGHTILLGSDGLFDNISHSQLSEIVAKGAFEESFQEIVKICTEQNPEKWLKEDDISFILIRKIKA